MTVASDLRRAAMSHAKAGGWPKPKHLTSASLLVQNMMRSQHCKAVALATNVAIATGIVALALDTATQTACRGARVASPIAGTTLAGPLQVRPPGKKHMHSRSIKRVSDVEKERLAHDGKYACRIRSRTSQATAARRGDEIPPRHVQSNHAVLACLSRRRETPNGLI